MSGRDEAPEIVRWYTRARKFPQMIGKTPDGAKLWGGPYTYTQVIGAAVVLVVGLKTIGLWGAFGLIGNALVVMGAAYGTALLLGRLPIGSRNPISVGTGIARALSRPAQGVLGGAPLRIHRPHRVRSQLVIRHAAPTAAVQTAAVTTAAEHPVSAAANPGSAEATTYPPARQLAVEPARRSAATPPEPTLLPPRLPALTGVQRLLASTGATPKDN